MRLLIALSTPRSITFRKEVRPLIYAHFLVQPGPLVLNLLSKLCKGSITSFDIEQDFDWPSQEGEQDCLTEHSFERAEESDFVLLIEDWALPLQRVWHQHD